METAVAPGSTSHCLFACRSLALAVPVEAVEAIVEAARLVRLPLSPWPLAGLCPHRGRFIPVVRPTDDPASRAYSAGGSAHTVLVLRTSHGELGLLIDRAGIAIEAGVETAPDASGGPGGPPGSPTLRGGFVAVGRIEREGRSHAVLDPDASWAGLRSMIERWYGTCLGVDSAAGQPSRPALGDEPAGSGLLRGHPRRGGS